MADVQFDADGDILLLLSHPEGVARFQVSSNVLCLASPVFRAMLGTKGEFQESKSLQEKKSGEPPVEITLADDDPKELAVILRIIHLQHDSVPETLSEENLWQIAILVDKYDLREAIKLWIKLWIQPYLNSAGLPLTSSSYFTGDKGVFLAYAFYNKIIFNSISQEIILTWMAIPGTRSLLRPHHFDWGLRVIEAGKNLPFFKYVPQSIVEALCRNREAYLGEMFKCIGRYISLYSGSQGVQCSHSNPHCDSTIFGTLVRKLNEFKLPTDPDEPIHHSMEHIWGTLAEIKPPMYVFFANSCSCSCRILGPCNCPKPRVNHAACFPITKLKDQILEIMEGVEGLKLARFGRKARTDKPAAVWDYILPVGTREGNIHSTQDTPLLTLKLPLVKETAEKK